MACSFFFIVILSNTVAVPTDKMKTVFDQIQPNFFLSLNTLPQLWYLGNVYKKNHINNLNITYDREYVITKDGGQISLDFPTNKKWLPSPCVPKCDLAAEIVFWLFRNPFPSNSSKSSTGNLNWFSLLLPPGPK